ncbi:MAG: sensor histidine kinase [Chloroflexota bacterium]
MQAQTAQDDLAHRAVMLLRQVEAEVTDLASQADERYHDLLAQWQERHSAAVQGSSAAEKLEQQLIESRRVAWQLNLLARLHRDLVGDLEGKNSAPEPADLKADLPRIRLIQSQEEGYLRLARELRNGVGQIMANAVLELEYLDHLSETDAGVARKGLLNLKQEIRAGFRDLQRIIEDLGPPPLLAELGLPASLRRYIENFREELGLEAEVDLRALPVDLPPTMEIAIFRVVQEALLNVRKHAQASSIQVRTYYDRGELRVSIADDGLGFQINSRDKEPAQHLGLILMRDRADLMGGRLQIRNREHRGSEVILSVPYPFAPATQQSDALGGKTP